MLFNSQEFLFFLPIVFLLYWFVFAKDLKWQNALILVASYFFYGWWSIGFLGLLVLSTVLDFAYGFGVANTNKKKAKFFLWLSIINNLGILAVFKYYNFFIVEFQNLSESIGFSFHPTLLQIALPVGISFYPFHGMSYVFDIYRERQKPVSNFIDYAVFVSFFPLLVAGPIERANHLLPQIQRKRVFSYAQAVDGCRLIMWGLIKKIVIADTLAVTVDAVFNQYEAMSSMSLLLGAVAFSFQIYGDFSGYSDIALGVSKLFGFELLSNFKFPYFSRSVAEFWRRWHFSHSCWFKDYLYIPLGGSKNGKLIAVRNTFIIFLVSGFWHGASWNFIIWGFIHACAFLPSLLANRHRLHVSNVVAQDSVFPSLKELGDMLLTFSVVTLAWIFFRADDITTAVNFIYRMMINVFQDPASNLVYPRETSIFIYIIPMLIVDWYLRRNAREVKMFFAHLPIVRYAVYWSAIYLIAAHYSPFEQSFIYFQF